MTLAACCLGNHRREWALAMQAEFEAALDDGKPLTFAIGCLVGAWRQMPAHEEGRFVLANYILVFSLILPVAAIMLANIITEFSMNFAASGDGASPLASAEHGPLLTDANQSAVPPLAIVVLLLIATHLRIAWLLLERDWQRVAATCRLTAASAVALAIFSSLVFLSGIGLIHAAVVAVELSGVLILARWHDKLRPPTSLGLFL